MKSQITVVGNPLGRSRRWRWPFRARWSVTIQIPFKDEATLSHNPKTWPVYEQTFYWFRWSAIEWAGRQESVLSRGEGWRREPRYRITVAELP